MKTILWNFIGSEKRMLIHKQSPSRVTCAILVLLLLGVVVCQAQTQKKAAPEKATKAPPEKKTAPPVNVVLSITNVSVKLGGGLEKPNGSMSWQITLPETRSTPEIRVVRLDITVTNSDGSTRQSNVQLDPKARRLFLCPGAERCTACQLQRQAHGQRRSRRQSFRANAYANRQCHCAAAL
jgi:hypothetical protein